MCVQIIKLIVIIIHDIITMSVISVIFMMLRQSKMKLMDSSVMSAMAILSFHLNDIHLSHVTR